jgi:hypothetical protein
MSMGLPGERLRVSDQLLTHRILREVGGRSVDCTGLVQHDDAGSRLYGSERISVSVIGLRCQF